jgi:hypothetical protein
MDVFSEHEYLLITFSSKMNSYSMWLQTVADAAQQTSKVIEGAKPIASSTIEYISTADPVVIVGTAGALFLTYLLLPPIWSIISFGLRGYQGELIDF